MKMCIVSNNTVEGRRAVKVKEDRIIKGIRRIKQMLGIAQMNELYVSEEHLEEHLKRRRSFEKSILFASVLAGLLVIAVLAALLLSGRIDVGAIASAFIIGVFVLMLPIFKYTPAVESKVPRVVGSAPGPAPRTAPESKVPAPKKEEPAKKKKTRRRKKR